MKDILKIIFKDQVEKVIFAYLFGSQARSDSPYPPRDIDLAVFFEERSDISFLDAKLNLYATLSRALRINNIDILVLNNASNLILLDEVIRNGVLLFDKDHDLREEFEQRILHQALDFKLQRASVLGV